MSPQPIKSKKVYQIIFNEIKESFLKGDLEPGDKLPPERELAARFKVSRTSIREALRVLEMNDIVDIRRGDGTFIKSSDVQILNERLSVPINNAEDNLVYEMLEVRYALETECAFMAAQRATSSDLDKIRKCLDDMNNAKKDEELGLKADLNFHNCIAKASHNSILVGLVNTLSKQMKNTIRATRKHRFTNPERHKDTIDEHKEIFLAIALKNPHRAKQLMGEHIMRIREEMTKASLERSDK